MSRICPGMKRETNSYCKKEKPVHNLFPYTFKILLNTKLLMINTRIFYFQTVPVFGKLAFILNKPAIGYL